jgi:hypothetical protein
MLGTTSHQIFVRVAEKKKHDGAKSGEYGG